MVWPATFCRRCAAPEDEIAAAGRPGDAVP